VKQNGNSLLGKLKKRLEMKSEVQAEKQRFFM